MRTTNGLGGGGQDEGPGTYMVRQDLEVPNHLQVKKRTLSEREGWVWKGCGGRTTRRSEGKFGSSLQWKRPFRGDW